MWILDFIVGENKREKRFLLLPPKKFFCPREIYNHLCFNFLQQNVEITKRASYLQRLLGKCHVCVASSSTTRYCRHNRRHPIVHLIQHYCQVRHLQFGKKDINRYKWRGGEGFELNIYVNGSNQLIRGRLLWKYQIF